MVHCTVVVALVVLVGSVRSVPTGNRIVGGQLADDTQMPYQIALFYNGRFRCGGSIIGVRHVLTAAHCLQDGDTVLDPALFDVHVGSADLNAGGQRYPVRGVYPHEKYGNFQNDIGLLEMKKPFHFDKYVQPIELIDEELPIGTEVVISGYGREGMNMPASTVLLYTTMFVVESELCTELGAGLICIYKEGNFGACNGDSGGPAVYDGKLVGVANFVVDTCGGSHPDGYAKVSFYRDWIDQHIN